MNGENTAGRRKRWGDRYDGRLLRTLNPINMMIPFIMRTRTDSQNLFEDRIEITAVQRWIRAQKDAGIDGEIGILHVVIAACVRLLATRPGVNRFVKNGRIYARKDITVSIAIKKTLDDEGIESTIKLRFDPRDTVLAVRDRVNAALEENKKPETENSTDRVASLLVRLPPCILKVAVAFLDFLDTHGWLPRALNEASPFHTSMWITDLGSIGIQSIYHHIYEFGTTSAFFAFGTRTKEKEISDDGSVHTRSYLTLRAVTDERIVDGYYYAATFRLLKKLLMHPELLETPPAAIPEDIE